MRESTQSARFRFTVPFLLGVMIAVGFLTRAVAAQRRPVDRELERLILHQDWDRVCAVLRETPPKPEQTPVLVASAWVQCLAEGRQLEAAWRFARDWVKVNPYDGEDIWVRYIDLTDQLFHRHRSPKFWDVYRSFLRHRNRFVRYYASFRLTYWDEDAERREALPVLREILERESDPNLLARAQLAWMRVDPKSVPEVGSDRFDALKAYILVQVMEQTSKAQVRLRLPLAWAVWWLKNSRNLPIDEATRERLIKSIQNARKLRQSQTLFEIMEPDTIVRILLVYGGKEKNTSGEIPP